MDQHDDVNDPSQERAMSETAERIWAARVMYTVQPYNRWPSPEPYIRLDLHEAEVAKLRAHLEETK